MNDEYDVVVVGAGIVGLTAAVAMRQRGYSVAILDAGKIDVDTSQLDRRVYALNKASENLLLQLGVWSQLMLTRLSPYSHMHVWDSVSDACIDFDARIISTNKLGTIVEESVLKQALLQQAQQLDVKLLAHCSVTKIEEDTTFITVTSEAVVYQAKLLLIADGAHSTSRELLRIPMVTWPYHQQALVALVKTEKSHQQTAYQVFNSLGSLAFLPMADVNICSIVWSTSIAHATHLISQNSNQFNLELANAFAYKLGQCELLGELRQFTLSMRQAKQYVGRRWLLMGDAAHTIHPLAGLGLNLGLADIAGWLALHDQELFSKYSSTTLLAYQRQRKYQVWKIIALMDVLKALFTSTLSPVATIRGIGLTICDRSDVLKRFFIDQASA
ncbi:MAG: FAD-dependent oxidoreductase [Legionella sp.]